MSLFIPLSLQRILQVSLLLCLISAVTEAQLPSQSESRAVPDRVSGPVDPSQRVPLPNHLPLWANAQNAQEPASGQMQLTIVLSPSPQQQSDLKKLFADQKNPASPNFHHWLTPAEVGERFGISDSDLDAVQSWLQSQGLHVRWIAPSRMFIGVNGAASDVGRAFGSEIQDYSVHGETRRSIASTPSIPAALGPVISSVSGLYTISDHHLHRLTSPERARPDLTLSNGQHLITPADFKTIYDLPDSQMGTQETTIGIVGRSRVDPADFQNMDFVLSQSFQMPTEVIPTAFGGVDPGPAYTSPPASNVSIGDQSEATLDVTRAESIASNKVLLVVATQASGGIEADAQYLVQTSPVPAQVMSISFGACESDAGASGVNFWNTLFEQASLEGITVLVSSGDSGASGCEQAFTTPSATPSANSPNYICSSGYATCVGGTEFNDTGNPSQYWNSSNGNPGFGSALGYIPEGAWNEPLDSKSNPQLASSGGGVSSIIATPAWQSGPGIPSARAGRYTPDVSFSSSCHDAYFGCLAAAGASCVADSTGAIEFVGFCGTSAAAPSMAGVVARLDDQLKTPEGNINPEIYALAQNQPSSFHDATPATSGVTSCSLQTPSMCNNSAPGRADLSGGQAGYALTTGYDEVTGVGSLDIAKFLQNIPSALPAPSFTFTPSATSITAGQALTITVAVAGGSGQPTPTGYMQLNNNGYNPPQAALVNGTATFSIGAGILGANTTANFTATYIPDDASSATYARASATYSVPLQLIQPTLSPTYSPASPSTAQNVTLTVNVGVGASDPTPTGTMNVSSTGANPIPGNSGSYTGSATLSSGKAIFNIPAGVLSYGTDYFTITYMPDHAGQNFYPQSSVFANLTVAQGQRTIPTLSTSLSASTISLADSVTITAKVTPASGTPMPTGTAVTMASNGQSITAPLNSSGVAKIVVPGSYMAPGNDTLNVVYNGDYNNQAVQSPAMVTVTKANAALTITPNATSIVTTQSLQVAVNIPEVNPLPQPTGNITLTSGTYTSPTSQVNGLPITIPGNTLAAGTDTLTVSYSGDRNYGPSTATATILVSPYNPSFSIQGKALTVTRGATTGNTVAVTVTPAGGFTGAVTMTAAITSGPAGAQYDPLVSFGTTSPVNIIGAGAGTATLTVSTTAPASGSLQLPKNPSAPMSQKAGALLACLFLVGIPAARRRKRYACARILLLLSLCSTLVACGGGGGGSGSSSPPPSNPGTTPGNYVVTITGTAGNLTATGTLNLTIQ